MPPLPSTQGVHSFPRRAFPSRLWPQGAWPAGVDLLPGGGVAAPLENWASGGDFSFTPGDPGETFDFLALVPIDEPLSVGPPPVLPALVRRLSLGFAVRSIAVRAGYRVTSPLATTHRTRYAVAWPALDDQERADLLAFFRDEVHADSLGGGRVGFDLEPDGPGSGVVVVRPLAAVEHTLLAFGSVGAHGVSEIECEELYTLTSGAGGVGGGTAGGGVGGSGGGGMDDGGDGSGSGGSGGGVVIR